MATILLQTKFYIPHQRPNFVPRPRLVNKVNEELNHKLTLVCAPAGFGKTTLVSDWIRQSDRPVAWLSLDEGDNDPFRFLAYLLTSLRRVEPNLGKGLLTVLQSPQPPETSSILTVLINNTIDVPSPFSLVLDDYHRIDNGAVHEILAYLLDHLPPQLHLVICTRVDPPLHLTRYRVQGELVEIRQRDLRFTQEEAAIYFNDLIGLNLSAADIAALDARTEGWIASLLLVALSLREHPDKRAFLVDFSGSHHYLIDYLMDEVMLRQPEHVRSFLCQASILDQFCAPLCDAVFEISTSRHILFELERANLFLVPLDDDRSWYRFHHLFAEFLHQQLLEEDSGASKELHRRASQWFEHNGFADRAVKHAGEAADYARAADLMEELAESLWQRGQPASLVGWIGTLPEEQLVVRPNLCIYQAWALYISGHQETAENRLQDAERALDPHFAPSSEDPPASGDKQTGDFRGRVAAIRALIATRQGAYVESIQYAAQADASLSGDNLMWRGVAALASGLAQLMSGEMNVANRSFSTALEIGRKAGNLYLVLSASLHLANVLLAQGRLKYATEICREMIDLADENGLHRMEMTGCAYDQWGAVEFEWNQVEKAYHLLKKGREISLLGKDIGVLGWSYLCQIKANFSMGDMSGARAEIRAVENLALASDVPPWITTPVETWKAKIWLKDGDLAAVSQWTSERGLHADEEYPSLREDEYVVLARVLIAQRRFDETQQLLSRLLPGTEAGGRTATSIEILLLRAIARSEQGDRATALEDFGRALSLAQPGGYVRTFVNEGPSLEKLLRLATKEDGLDKNYLLELIRAFETERHQEQPVTTQPLLEPLSGRELEVLQRISRGLSNQEIAAELVVSINTIKAHTKNIYGKLDVHGRMQAAQRAKELELL